ncbi:hypothetical protein Tco_0059903 [Tanacetum coccineum]
MEAEMDHKELGFKLKWLKMGRNRIFLDQLLAAIDELDGEMKLCCVGSSRDDMGDRIAIGGTDYLPTATIFEELARIGYEKPSQKLTFYKAFFSAQWKFLIHTITQCLSAKSTTWNEFSSTMASLIICILDDSLQTPITTQPSSSKSQKKQSRRKQRKDTAVLDLEKAKDAQAKEIAALKKRVQKLEKKKKSRTTGLKRLRKGRSDGAEMFDINDLHGDEVTVDMLVGEKQEQSAKERDVDTSVEAKPKVVTTAATTTTTTRPKARGVVVQEPSEFRTQQESQPSMTKDKGKGIMIDPKLEAKLIEEERLARKKRYKKDRPTLALIESEIIQSYDGRQIFELAQKLHIEEKEELTIEERIKMLSFKSKKETEEGSKGTEDELEFDKSKKEKSSEEKAKGSRKKRLGKKRVGKEQQQESSKRQRMEDDKETNEHEEVKVDNEAELKKHLAIVKDNDIAINAIPLATKPPVIVEYKLIKEGIMAHYQLIKVDGSSKRYSSMIRML